MTRDEINARLEAAQAELATVRQDIINGRQDDPPADLSARRDELTTEIAALSAMLDEL
jgi:uncharacterized protein YceH (UPF0502 family)